jgi:polysaccharide pyruvyl transferase WcaK-like protein
VRWVYSRADFISVRDSPSMDVLRRLDLDSVQVTESPDLVFLTGEGSRRPAGPDAPICLSINGLQALAGCDEWRALMDGLVALGRPLRFVSNAMNHDREFARGLAETWPVEVIDCQPTPAELEAIFGECAVLISSRLHASIMALGAGTPVVSIEPQVFKLTAIFEQMRYPIGTENIKASGWSARTLAKVGRALAERDALAREGVEAIERQVARIDAAYAPMFALAPRAQTAE